MPNPDFRDLSSAFNAERVECLVVGAHARRCSAAAPPLKVGGG
jgi:hypothetical protein